MERKQSINYRRDRVIGKIDLSKTEHGAGRAPLSSEE